MPDYFISREKAETDLLACAAFLAERIRSADGHAEAMNEIIPRYLARGEVDLAAELANAVGDPFSRDRLLIAVAERCAHVDDDEYAMQLADAIEDHGLQAQAYERAGLVKAGKGQPERAEEYADALAHPDFVYAGIAVHHAAGGDDVAADATLDSIEFASAKVSALSRMAARYSEDREREKAELALDRAVDAALDIEHDEERIRALCDLGNLFVEARRNDRAITTFDQARTFAESLTNVHRDLFLVNCSLGFLYAGSTELADRTLDLVRDKTQMASALLGFARDHWKKDEKVEAVEALEEAYEILRSQRESETRDSRSRNGLLATIAAQFAAFEKPDRGVEIALENKDPNEQMAALSQIAQVLTMAGDDGGARQTINLIAEDSNRLFALIAMSDAKVRLDDKEAALSLLDEAARMDDSVTQHSSRSSVLNTIADRYASHGQHEKARAAARQSLAVISEIRDESSQAAGLAVLADVYDQAGFEPGDVETETIRAMMRRAEW
jgi:tetratricopeptide (TPR) repeat protein